MRDCTVTRPQTSSSKATKLRAGDAASSRDGDASHTAASASQPQSSRRLAVTGGWWERAACAGRDPTWWSEQRLMWPAAVTVCLSCPVRESCLADAVAQRDNGVIRGGMLLVDSPKRGHTATSLVCDYCRRKPVRVSTRGRATRYCGSACQTAASRARASPPGQAAAGQSGPSRSAATQQPQRDQRGGPPAAKAGTKVDARPQDEPHNVWPSRVPSH